MYLTAFVNIWLLKRQPPPEVERTQAVRPVVELTLTVRPEVG